LESARNTFDNLDKLAQSLQRLISTYKPLNSELKILVGFLKSKIDLAYEAYAKSAPDTENEAMKNLPITAKLARDAVRENTSQPGFFQKLFRKEPNSPDPLEMGITQIIDSKLFS
jgi:hypothetical protein